MKVFSFVCVSLGFLVASFSAFAGGNVALHVTAKKISFSDRAKNNPDYASMNLEGDIKLSDAVIENFPGGPNSVSILYNPTKREHIEFIKRCEKLVLKKSSVIIGVFMKEVNRFPTKVEGGMADVKFNTYVLKLDGDDFDSFTCGISLD